MGRELVELWREHDSTGLRAEAKLIHTALAVRVAPKTHAKFSVAYETTQQHIREAFGLPFFNGYCPSPWFEAGDGGCLRDVCACDGRAKSIGRTQNAHYRS